MKPTVRVYSRHVSIGRGGKVLWGNWVQWSRYSDNAKNLAQAIKAATNYLLRGHIGSIIYINQGRNINNAIPIWQGKWGTDNKPFFAWKSNPVGEYWKRKLS